MATGSDTRMYSPRSESNLGYSKDDDDYKHGYGDPEQMEQVRDQKQAEKEKPVMSETLPHLQITNPEPQPPMMPPMPEEEEEPPMMDDQFNEGQQFGAQTGMPDMGNLSLGAATGTMPAPGGMLATGEPMEDAWSSLLKQDEEPFSFNLNEVFKSPNHEWYDQIMGMETPMIQNLVNSGMMDAMGYKNHHHGDAETLSGMHEENLHPQASMDMVMEHRNSLLVLDAMMQGKGDTVPQQFRDQHQNADMTRMLSDAPSHAQVAANIAGLYTNLNYLGQLIGPQMGEPDDDFRTKNASEPMEDAWSSLMKSKLDDMGSAKDKTWRQPQFEIQPGGAEAKTANPRRAKRVARNISPAKKRGLELSPFSVHRTHLGDKTKQPLRLFPQKYGQQQATQSRRKLMGNVPQIPSSHGIGAETDYNPRVPKVGGSGQIKEPQAIREKGKGFAKSIEGIRSDMEEVRKKMNYMQFTQMRRLMRDLKDALERKDKSKKGAVSSGPGEKGKAGHREGQDSTTRNEGATEDLENDPKNWGAPSTLFAAPGSGRVG